LRLAVVPSRVHIVTGPSASENEVCLRAHAQHFAAPIWLLPTERQSSNLDHAFTFPQLALKLAAPPTDQPLLSEPQQRLLMRHAVEELVKLRKLKALGKLIDTPSGVGLIFSFISELKKLGVGPDQFAEFAAEAQCRPLLDRDVTLVYRSYQDLLTRHGFLDRDAVYRLALKRERWPTLGDALLVDGFAGFTPPQLAVLQRLASHVGEMWLSLPGDGEHSERYAAVKTAEVFEAFPGADSTEPSPPTPLLQSRERGAGTAAGLAHLSQYLFVDNAQISDQADGLLVIEGPGIVGEVRMVARAIKTQLNAGIPAESILVAIRNLSTYADLIDETFVEYGIPFELDAALSLSRVPVVAGLLKATAIAYGGYQFADVSALLRSTLFRPGWPELVADSESPLAADMLLRQLNEPRGRDSILNAASRWAAAPPVPLEDEEAEKSQQSQIHELAKRCLPFLQRFFALWDDAPKLAAFDIHVGWYTALTKQLGWPEDDPALQQFHADLAGWAERELRIAPKQTWKHEEFLDRLSELAALANRPRSTAAPGQVRVLSADSSAGLSYDHFYLLGLGERGFPDLSGRPSLYDEGERAAFRGFGLDLDVAVERLPAEKLLFLRLVNGARQSVTLSYPATDEKGQELLAGSFLRTIRDDLFSVKTSGQSVIAHERRTMLTDGLDTDEPLSVAEQRVRYARPDGGGSLSNPDLTSHMAAVQRMSLQRYGKSDFGPFDGMLTNAVVRKETLHRFGSDKSLSPTALEAYISCPFKFFAGRVLKLAKIEEPSEEIEAHRRGSAYHRALTRLHRGNRQPADPGKLLSEELAIAIGEYAERAGSRTTRILWQLELERLQRSAVNYTAQTEQHRSDWSEFGRPRTEFLEEPYEVIVEVGGNRMKLGGRIDRIDVIETDAGVVGFLVVDYKTGRGSNYTKNAVQRLEQLQLAVYALAAEQWLGDAEPLGLLYWLPLDKGPKVALGGDKLKWTEFRRRLELWLIELSEHIRAGEFPLKPRSDDSCNYCDYKRMCRIAQGNRDKTWNLPLPMVEGDVDE
jgi:ATP-dependent helicase/nuclease subunit B